MRKSWVKKGLVCGIILLFVGTSVLPSITGDIEKKKDIPQINKQQYTLVRDDYGVPHVFANTTEDLAFGAGYAIAQDRLWQADLYKREATGRLSEFGLASLEYDHNMRVMGYTREENTELFESIASPYKEMIIAYTAGMNQYIAEALADPVHKMPIEYLKKGLTPEPWTVEDSLAISQMMVRRFGEGGGNEMIFTLVYYLLKLKNGPIAGWKIFNDACPLVDPGAATTLNGSGDPQTPAISPLPPMIPAGIIPLAKEIVAMKQMDKEISEANGLLYHFGSNGWVVTPKKSATGNALLLGGPQMGYSIPQIVVEIGLHGAGINATGMTFPGIGPAIAIGVSEWGAWTTTSGMSDGIDTYIEILNPFNRTKYLSNHQWCSMERRIETIYDVNGTPHKFECLRTVHGPVLAVGWVPLLGGFAVSQRMTFWKEEQHTLEGVMSFQQCHNITEFEQGVSKIVSSHNWFWADRNGDVGYYHSGWYPIRPKYGLFHRLIDKRFPLIGTGKEEWLGIVPFSELPQGRNPESGFYANWNNKPRADWPYSEAETGQLWGEGHIVVRIQELLAADDSITFDDMIEICRNVSYHDAYGTYFKPFLLNAISHVGGIPSEVVTALESWDCYLNDANGDGFYDDPGYTIFTAWYDAVFTKILADELSPIVKDYSYSLLLHIFQANNSKLHLRYHNYLDGVPLDTAIVNALHDALTTLSARFGTTNISAWLSPVSMVDFTELGALSSPVMPYMNRGTYNQIAELPRWLNSTNSTPPIAANVLPPGQSGFVDSFGTPSPHAYDQLDLYTNWQFKPMLFTLDGILS